jgi:hypothetical protein
MEQSVYKPLHKLQRQRALGAERNAWPPVTPNLDAFGISREDHRKWVCLVKNEAWGFFGRSVSPSLLEPLVLGES